MKQWIILIIILLAFTIHCEVDHGIAPLPGKLAATVRFHGTAPANTEGIYLIVAPQFPPHAINELYQSPNSLPIDQAIVSAEVELPYGHYQAVSLWWYNTETKSNLADVLALPLDPKNSLMPLGFDITPKDPIFKIDLDAYWSLVDRDATIEGTIYFNGPFPKNTSITAVAAYLLEPEVSFQYLSYLKSIDYSINKNPYHYKLPIHHGTINYIVVFWLPERTNLTDFRTIGVYEDPKRPGKPGKVKTSANETVTGIDIYADWSTINSK
jgi:hypothetical protein